MKDETITISVFQILFVLLAIGIYYLIGFEKAVIIIIGQTLGLTLYISSKKN